MKSRSVFLVVILILSFEVGGYAQEETKSPLDIIAEDLKPLTSLAKDISSIYSGATDAIKLLQFIGFIPSGPSDIALLQKIDAKIDDVANLLYDHETLLARAQLLAQANAAAQQADRVSNAVKEAVQEAERAGKTAEEVERAGKAVTRLPEFGAADLASAAYVNFVMDPLVFTRRYFEPRTDGGTVWKGVIFSFGGIHDGVLSIKPLVEHGDGTVYDWRFNLHHLMYAIAIRIKVITAIHPEWRIDGHFDDDLLRYATGLSFNLNKMLNGVKCGYVGAPSRPNHNNITFACADIYTGLSIVRQDLDAPEERLFPEIEERLLHQILLQMPIFEMQSMIDTLNFYLSHAPDLTADLHRIPIEHSQNLCLDVRTPDKGELLSYRPCAVVSAISNGSLSQEWIYDRMTGQIRNPWANKCLETGVSFPFSGEFVKIFDCNGTPPQQWTYDPLTNVLQSPAGTVLGFRSGFVVMEWPVNSFGPELQFGQQTFPQGYDRVQFAWDAAVPVIEADQRWHADRPVNNLVTFEDIKSTWQTIPNNDQCPSEFAGQFHFDGLLTNAFIIPLSDIVLRISTLTGGNQLENTDQHPGGLRHVGGGAGDTVTIPSDPMLLPGESLSHVFVLCLKQMAPFEFFMDVYGGILPESRSVDVTADRRPLR